MKNQNKAVAVREDKALFTREAFDEPRNFQELLSACKILVASKILPKEIDTEEKAAVVILTGRELGLRMMASTRGIYVVNQKPALSAQMMLALAYNTKEVENLEVIDSGKAETASCSVTVKRKGKKPYVCSFSVDEAKKLGKYANEWLKQPETMCRSRAISKNLRVTFPDAILGMYTPEEVYSITTEQEDAKPASDEMPKSKSGKEESAPVETKSADVVGDEPKIGEAQVKVIEKMLDTHKLKERFMPWLKKTYGVEKVEDIKASWLTDILADIAKSAKEK